MSLYEGIKDIAKLLQKAGNIELYSMVLDLESQALELQAVVSKLQEENRELKRKRDLEDEIVYHSDPYLTKKSDNKIIRYCAACWASKSVLVPLQVTPDYESHGTPHWCPLCDKRFLVFYSD